ncbi:MAG: flagellar hook-basal body complex protein, partial [Mariprofundales bacterium]|nr:flagellar hook-basal body complex protein [Mariprofundales bacterium]
TNIGGSTPAADLVIPAGAIKDQNGVVNAASFTLKGDGSGTNLGTAAQAAGLSNAGPYTLLSTINSSFNLTAGQIVHPENVFTGTTAGTTIPATLSSGTQLSGSVTVGAASLTIPAGGLKDSAGKSNAVDIVLPAGTSLSSYITTNAAALGISTTGPYTMAAEIKGVTSTLTAGTLTLQTQLAAGLVSIPPISSTATTGIFGVGPQSMVFDANGALVREFSPSITLPWNGANANQLAINMGSATTTDAQGTSGGKGLDGVVQLAGAFATRQMTRDGFTSGFLDKLETDSTGVIFGVFTNGQRRPLFQVALANFPNSQVLSHMGSNLQQETIASGTPVMEKPGNGGMGSISPFGLEQSNVDLAGEFVKLIIVQRGYEANSKTITTTDQMLGSLMQLKR